MNIWISYCYEDKKFVEILKKYALTEGIEVYTKDNVKPGESLVAKISSAIKSADIILVIVSSHSSTNDWQISEIATSIHEGKFIIPIQIDKNIPIPVFLRNRQYIDFTDEKKFGAGFDLLKDALLRKRTLNEIRTLSIKQYSDFITTQKNFTQHMIESETFADSKNRQPILEKLTLFIVIISGIFSILTIGIIGDFTVEINPFLMGLITGIITVLIAKLLSIHFLKVANHFRSQEADK